MELLEDRQVFRFVRLQFRAVGRQFRDEEIDLVDIRDLHLHGGIQFLGDGDDRYLFSRLDHRFLDLYGLPVRIGKTVAGIDGIRAQYTEIGLYAGQVFEDLPADRHLAIGGYLSSDHDGLDRHPYVINGCSELFSAIWGVENGVGVRSAVGFGSLPGNIPVEIEAIFLLR